MSWSSSARRVRVLRGGEAGSAAALAFPAGPARATTGTPVPARAFEDELEAARRAGFEEGYRKGLEEAAEGIAARRQAALDALVARLEAALAATEAEREAAVEVAALEVATLAVDVAEALVGHELARAGQPGKEALARVLALVPDGPDLVVRLRPDEVLPPEELASLLPGRKLEVLADPTVEPGGCVVEAGPCRLDAQLGPALERVRAVLSGEEGDR
jgi:flagellar assembly protein FliH